MLELLILLDNIIVRQKSYLIYLRLPDLPIKVFSPPHTEQNMRMRNSSMDGSDGSQLFDDTSAAGAQGVYRWEPS